MDKLDRKLLERYLGNIEKHSACNPAVLNNVGLVRNLIDEEAKRYSDRANTAWDSKRRLKR